MASLLLMPSLSPTMETGVISAWMKKAGDSIEPGEVLAEIETDKAVMEWEFNDEGIIREILVEVGQEISVGTPIAILAESKDEDIAELLNQAKSGAAPAPSPAAQDIPAPADAHPVTAPAPTAAQAPATTSHAMKPVPPPPPAVPPPTASPQATPGTGGNGAEGGRVKISPYAKKLAESAGIDWSGLHGTGTDGRIVARDIEDALAGGVAPTGGLPAGGAPAGRAIAQPAFSGAPYEDLPLSMMRKAIARKMVESKTTVPHFQLTRKLRVEKLLAAREQINSGFPDTKVSINDVIVKACAAALRMHPVINSQFLDDRIRRFNTVDISIAVGTEDGLITPVVRNADMKGLRHISMEIRELAGRAKDKKLTPEDYEGGTFSISNLGMYGVNEFNAIINTPQACILAVSGVVKEPVVEGNDLIVGHTMSLTLSSDHRVVDGVSAAQFMDTLSRLIENPLAMLL